MSSVVLGIVVFLVFICVTPVVIRSQTPDIEHRLDIQRQPYKGLLLVRRRGTSDRWGTVCDDGWMNPNNARVACRALGYTSGELWYSVSEGNSSTPIYLDDLSCNGTETSLAQCMTTTGWGQNDCFHSEDVGLSCDKAETFLIEARLRGGASSNAGLLEVRKKGDPNAVWGSVCDDHWNLGNGSNEWVACRQMNYRWGTLLKSGAYPVGSGEIHLDNVQCSGHEPNLANCTRNKWLDHNCYHSEDVGLTCYNTTVMVARIEADSAYGTVGLVADNGTIYSVCDESWTDNDATVACRELGYPYWKRLCCSQYESYMPMLRSNLHSVKSISCAGSESRLADCPRVVQTGGCPFERQASLVCSRTPIPPDSEIPVRLVGYGGAVGTYTGKVQVQRYGVWSDVCSEIEDKEAKVICKQRGYSTGFMVGRWSGISSSSPSLFTNLNCSGTETKVKDCSYNWTNAFFCSSRQKAFVICSSVANEDTIQVRLADGGKNYGRVEVRFNNTWGTVCDQSWSSSDAKVVCKQLGYWTGEAKRSSAFGEGSGPVYLSGLQCSGREKSIVACQSSRGFAINVTSAYCTSHANDAGVICHGKVWLDFGGNVYASRDHVSGIVLVADGDRWKAVCGTGWNDAAAKIACKELGYPYGKSLCCSSFGSLWSYSVQAPVSCVGNETSVADCPQTGSYCSGYWRNYASVYCSRLPITNSSAMTTSLTHGSPGYEDVNGMVVVHYNNQAGTICASRWTDNEAKVVCRHQGLDGGVAYAFRTGMGSVTYPVMMSGVRCAGTETRLDQCTYTTTTYCSTSQRAGVLCYNGTRGVEYRLSGGNQASLGRVEIAYRGVWGTVCIDGWSRYDTMTLCKQLGYIGGEPIWNTFRNIDAPRYVSGLRCNMQEPTLLLCRNSGWRMGLNSSCTEAAASCYNDTRLAYKVSSFNHVMAGIVRIYNQLQWHSVCATSFNEMAARVTCRSLGFTHSIVEPGLLPVVGGVTSSMYSGVTCTGTENSLKDCRYEYGPRRQYCPDAINNMAVVTCADTDLGASPLQSTPAASVNYKVSSEIFVGGATARGNHTGYILLTRNGIQGPVCIRTFDDKAANVTCKAAGYRFGVVSRPVGRFNQPHRWAINFRCSGLESNLTDCQKIWGVEYRRQCTNDRDVAAAICYNRELRLRLAGGSSPNSGRVELNHDGTWGSVCCDTFCSQRVAQLACRQLGFVNGSIASALSMSGTRLNRLITLWNCPDNATNIFLCRLRWTWTTSQFCKQDLAVQCVRDMVIEGGSHTGPLRFAPDRNLMQVCRDNFTDKDAAVACRAAGFSGQGKSVTCGNYPISESTVIGRFGCTGLETGLRDCGPVVTSAGSCASRQAAVVSCVYDSSNSRGIHGGATLVLNGPHVELQGYRAAAGSVRLNVSGVAFRIGAQGWDDNDARVACTSMGYAWGVAYKHGPVTQGVPFIADNVGCGSTTTNFMDCLDKSKVFTPSSCNTTIEAGVICTPSPYVVPRFRLLSGGSGFVGRLSISVLGQQGAVCQDGFTDIEATVACRQFGRKTGRVSSRTNIRRLPTIIVEGLKCSGHEQRLMDCVWGGLDHIICPSQRQVALECYDDVYITGGLIPSFGMVQISRDGGIYAACDENFDDNAAKVVCKGLGFVDGIKICCQPFGAKPNQVFLNNVRCTGSEKSLLNCTYDRATCSSGRYASVYCFASPVNTATVPSVRLMGASPAYSSMTGEVALRIGGVWGRLCRHLWDDKDASVVCKGFGFPAGVAYQYRRRIANPIMYGGFNCTGSETRLVDCPYSNVAKSGGCTDWNLSAGVLCYRGQAPTFRLAGGSRSGEGRVEVNYDGVWGTVCNQLWSRHDAAVLCKHLSSDYVDGRPLSSGEVAAGTGPVYMTGFQCTGDEKSLFQCSNAGWRTVTSTSCNNHWLDAAVQCSKRVELSEGWYGKVRIYQGSNWQTLCDDTWTQNNADVLCRSLGHQGGFPICCSGFGVNFHRINDTRFSCRGSETSLTQCPSRRAGFCTDGKYASVVCRNGTADQEYRSIRISEGDDYSGMVEIQYQGVWGGICPDKWDDSDARVVCRELGFTNGVAYTHFRTFGSQLRNGMPHWTSNVTCHGQEPKLQQCGRVPYGGVTSCTSKHSAGVICYKFSGVYYRVNGGGSCPTGYACTMEGSVQVQVNSTWGNLCSMYWNDRNARVLCKSKGYASGITLSGIPPSRPAGAVVWESDIYCSGKERTLLECPRTAWKKQRDGSYGTCSSYSDATVHCFNRVRLFNSSSAIRVKTGSVQVYREDVDSWSPVCADNFTDQLAARVCNELGYVDGVAICCSAYGPIYSKGVIYGDISGCNSSHSSLSQCVRNATDPCQTYASVVCYPEHITTQKDVYKFDLEAAVSGHGRIEVTYLGQKGHVCANGWDDVDARIFCKSKGFTFGIAQRLSAPSRIRPPYLVSNFRCSGQSRLEDCPYDTRLNLGNCSHLEDAGVYCYNGGGIGYRLGSVRSQIIEAAHFGRAEMSVDNVWGTVCDRQWDAKEAEVFCRSVGQGYNGGDALYTIRGGSGPIWLSHLVCKGTESALHACAHPGFKSSVSSTYRYCTHDRDAGAVCYKSVRLNQILSRYRLHIRYGTVLAYQSSGWGGVCVDSWDDNDAAVVCKELGYSYGRAVPRSSFGIPVVGTDSVYTRVQCTGTESSFSQCAKQTSTRCDQYAGVYCTKDPIPNIDFKLNISSNGWGIVGLTKNGIDGRICSNGWGLNEASVTCKQLGYKGGVPYFHPTLDPRPIVLSNVSCTGNEGRLQQCLSADWGDAYACPSDRLEAGVLCYKHAFSVRLVGSDGSEGRVEIDYDGAHGTICDFAVGHTEAAVICRQLGFKDGLVVDKQYPGGPGKMWLSMVDCRGEEEHILACVSTGWDDGQSSYYCYPGRHDLAVKCVKEKMNVKKVRLVDGDGDGDVDGHIDGRVEVYVSGLNVWGQVCDDSWDDNDAQVVCRMLGFKKGFAILGGTFGVGYGGFLLDDVNCTGAENSISECQLPGIGDHNCSPMETAGVRCKGILTPTKPPGPVTTATTTTTTMTTTTPKPTKPGVGVGADSPQAQSGAIAAGTIIPLLLVVLGVVVGFYLYRRWSSSAPAAGTGSGAPVAIDNALYGMNLDGQVIPCSDNPPPAANGENPGVTIDNANLVRYAAPIEGTQPSQPNTYTNESVA